MDVERKMGRGFGGKTNNAEREEMDHCFYRRGRIVAATEVDVQD